MPLDEFIDCIPFASILGLIVVHNGITEVVDDTSENLYNLLIKC